jgi:hypothetical protein
LQARVNFVQVVVNRADFPCFKLLLRIEPYLGFQLFLLLLLLLRRDGLCSIRLFPGLQILNDLFLVLYFQEKTDDCARQRERNQNMQNQDGNFHAFLNRPATNNFF